MHACMHTYVLTYTQIDRHILYHIHMCIHITSQSTTLTICYHMYSHDGWILPNGAVRCPRRLSSWQKRETLLRAASANGPRPRLSMRLANIG